MYLCPITKTKLVSAYAGGGRLYYSKASRGRMLTYSMMKFFIGEHAAKDIFFRAKSHESRTTDQDCPSCSRKMKEVQSPKWTGGYPVDVCTTCHVFWLEANTFNREIPSVEAVKTAPREITINKEEIENQTKLLLAKEEARDNKETGAPDDLFSKFSGIVGLPVEIHKRDDPFGLIGKVLALLMLVIFIIIEKENVFRYLGFYPSKGIFGNGVASLVSPFIHASWFHLLTNLYFFLLFADDIEDFLRPLKFLLFLFVTIIAQALIMPFISHAPNVAHVGLSGVISAIIIFYALQFRKTKVGFCIPVLTRKVHFQTTGVAHLSVLFQWYRFPVLFVVFWWFAKDIALYFYLETEGVNTVSYSSHLVGFVTGIILWFLWGERQRIKLSNN